jgi:hypothetical protein
VGGINLGINNLNVSLNNPRFIGAIKALHDCGLVMLDLESNNIAGGLSKDWAQLKHLQHLNIGEAQCVDSRCSSAASSTSAKPVAQCVALLVPGGHSVGHDFLCLPAARGRVLVWQWWAHVCSCVASSSQIQ